LFLVTAALLYNLAYPPFHLFLPSFLCLVPLVLLLDKGSGGAGWLRAHLAQGFWFGVMANGILFHWVAVALWTFKPWAWLAYGPAILLLGLYTGALFVLVALVRRRTALPLLLVFPAAWTALEWLLAHHPIVQLSWLGLGTSLTRYPVFVQVADVIGARGLTYLLATANVALALAWKGRAERRRMVTLLGGVVVGVVAVTSYGAVRINSMELRSVGDITVVQPNIKARQKWIPGSQDSLVEATLVLSEFALQSDTPDLVVWPEVALPGPLPYHAAWERQLAEHAWDHGTPVLVGALDLRAEPDGSASFYNAAFLFEPSPLRGRQAPYYKHSLVLLFERFNGISTSRSGGVFETPIGDLGVMICYETAFEQFARTHTRDGASILVDMSNDAWFSATTGPAQHFAHLVMRAIETRRGVARAANTGPSGFVDPLGHPHDLLPENVATFVTAPLITSDAASLYVSLGDWVGMLSLLLTLSFAVASVWRRGLPDPNRQC
jgi:apolipoprotein N-acyltransferase